MVYQSDGCQQQQSDDHIEKPSVKVTAQRISQQEQYNAGDQQGDQRDQGSHHSLFITVHHHAKQDHCCNNKQ